MVADNINSIAFLDWIRKCNTLKLDEFVNFMIEDKVLGAVHADNLPLLSKYPKVFQVHSNKVVLHPRLDNPEARTAAVDEVLREWHAKEAFPSWNDEYYRVSASFDSPPYMLVERSASSFFGFLSYGVHVNGFVRQEHEILMWIARRADQRASYPGSLDHLVAGGHPAHLQTHEVLIKECAEEAGIHPSLAGRARSVGMISYCMSHEQRLKRDIIFIYDLELPSTFIPRNSDGEVSDFYLWPTKRIIELVSGTQEFKHNCNLVLIDFFMRHGYLRPEHSCYVEIAQKLRSSVSLLRTY